MNHTAILRRAFDLVRRYWVLWILGILLALTSGGGGNGPTYTFNVDGPGPNTVFGSGAAATWMGVIALVLCAIFLLAIVFTVVRYVVQAALFRSVALVDEAGGSLKFGQAWRLGWNWRAVRLFLIDLLIGIPLALFVMVALVLALSPLLLLFVDSDAMRVMSGIMTAGLVMLVAVVLVVVFLAVSLLKEFIWRAAALDDTGVIDAFKTGWQLVRRQWQNVGIMWLWMAGITLIYLLVLVPVIFLLGALGLGLAGGLGWALYNATNSILSSLLVGLPLALAIFVLPLLVISGLFMAYTSSVWTLTYREVKRLAA